MNWIQWGKNNIIKFIPIKKLKTSLFGIMFGISIGFGYEEFYGIGTRHSFETPTQSLSICFTPPSGCGSLIARKVMMTHNRTFTCKPIALLPIRLSIN